MKDNNDIFNKFNYYLYVDERKREKSLQYGHFVIGLFFSSDDK
jgi:hypothetical protein